MGKEPMLALHNLQLLASPPTVSNFQSPPRKRNHPHLPRRIGAHLVSKYKCRFTSVSPKKYEILGIVVKKHASFGKYVRLNLLRDIVEVLDCNSAEIVVNYKGEKLRMSHSEISWATPEEAAAAAERISG